MTFPRNLAVVLAAVPVLALSACGSSDSSKTLDKSALAAKANAICAKANAVGKKIPVPTSQSDLPAVAKYFAASTIVIKQQQKDLNALRPADDVKDDWNAFIKLDDQGTQYIVNAAAAAKAKDTAKLQEQFTALSGFSAKINPVADAVGATTCGSKSS